MFSALDFPVPVPDSMPRLNLIKSLIHVFQIIMTLITVFIVAPIISTEVQYEGASQAGPNYTLFIALFGFFLSWALIGIPYAHIHFDTLSKAGRFVLDPRNNLLLNGFGVIFWFTGAVASSVQANLGDTCSLDNHKGYEDSWERQCGLSKAAAGFSWLVLLLWVATFISGTIILWYDRKLCLRERQLQQQQQQTVIVPPPDDMDMVDIERDRDYDMERGYYEKDRKYSFSSRDDTPEDYHSGMQATSSGYDHPPYLSPHMQPVMPTPPPSHMPVIYPPAASSYTSPPATYYPPPNPAFYTSPHQHTL